MTNRSNARNVDRRGNLNKIPDKTSTSLNKKKNYHFFPCLCYVAVVNETERKKTKRSE